MIQTKVIPFRMAADGVYEVTAADLFCGAGGTSTGLVEAIEELEKEFGVKIRLDLIAVNHWDVAIATHSANHKFAHHKCDSLTGVNPEEVIPGHLDLLVASPECTHHSNARGGKPMNDQSRSSGDDVVRWIRIKRPSMVIIENVREYRTWGPLGKDGRPLKKRKGEYFQKFLADIRALGYQTEDRLLCCADYACPTTRTRLFVYCKRTQWTAPISWPAPSHAKASKDPMLVGALPKWLTARDHVIDWTDHGQSIFNRKRPLSPNTMRRIEAGLKKFSGIDLGGYLVKLYGTSDAASTEQPVPTVTGGGNHIGLAVPVPVSSFQIRTDCGGGKTAGYRGIDDPVATVTSTGGPGIVEPQSFILPKEGVHGGNLPRSVDAPAQTVVPHHGLGYMIEPSFIVPQFSEAPAKSTDEPVGTITTTSRGIGLAQPSFLLGQQTPAAPRSTDEPVPTVSGRGAISKIEPFFTEFHTEGSGEASRVRSTDEPLPTVTANGKHFSVAAPYMVAHFGEREGQEPRTHSVDDPVPAVTSRGAAELAVPYITEYHATQDGKERVRPVEEPLPTLDCSNRFGLAEPQFMLSAGGPEVAARSVEEPAHTVLTRDHIAFAAPFIAGAGGPTGSGHPQSVEEPLKTVIGVNHRAVIVPVTHPDKPGTDPASRTRSVDQPLQTITTARRGEIGVAQAFLVQYNGTAETASVDEPLKTLTGKPRFALLVTFTNGEKILLDILFRMLRVRELARAQSFSDLYQFIGKTEDVVKQIGNAVPPKMSKALCKTALIQCFWRTA